MNSPTVELVCGECRRDMVPTRVDSCAHRPEAHVEARCPACGFEACCPSIIRMTVNPHKCNATGRME